ncbi:hypothetical protein PSECIP111951_01355 [Pseudoalteromonas holothuriae]|uniref:DUF2306 domain-containing protein n=1 Tax=Pseudoalteromonas holothuriae TaxID=2963714 RepID=A0A9W4QQM5_9GAMM|nr:MULTISPECIES: hypothetical protein [unclassified Pseudoalteromonas]CAH9049432.1 hypothetical protein PSECIP111854_00065 [Pseudoalteromonas sp. CIP111854]CAH9055954.1 hypothetical protein PSECIP111951_01355 [Pseudoalteromonas sp. CIP111951]
MLQSIILYIHITFGVLAVVAGYIALFSEKGKRKHIKAGNWFVVTMVLMGISGVVVAYLKPMDISVIAGLFTLYLVISGVGVFKFANHRRCKVNITLMIACLCVGIYSLVCAYWTLQSDTGLYQGFTAEPFIMFGILAVICGLSDIRYMTARELSYIMRLTRHIWRMCFALFIAVGSFVGQGLQSFPEEIRSFALVEYADLIILLIMFYWLARSRGLVLNLKNRVIKGG